MQPAKKRLHWKKASKAPGGWIRDFRVQVGSFKGELIDISDALGVDTNSYQMSRVAVEEVLFRHCNISFQLSATLET